MGIRSFVLWLLATAVPLASSFPSAGPESANDFEPEDIVTRDVCILGGGSSGTYAAIRLHGRGQSVVVVEPKDRLGGHAETEYFPDGEYIEYGVEGIFDNHVTREYLSRLDVDYKPLLPASLDTDYVNFKTGQTVPSGYNILSTLLAATLYRGTIEKFDYLKDGLYNLPDPVPDELLRPFGEFIENNALEQGALDLIFTFASGTGNMLETPLLYVLQDFGIAHVDALLSGYITPTDGFAELYRKAAAAIGRENIMFRSMAAQVTRTSDSGVSVVVRNRASGKRTLVKAKKLLVAFPPTIDNLQPFDLDVSEAEIFQKYFWNSYFGAVVNNTGIPTGRNVKNRDPSEPYGLPVPPFQWQLTYMGVPGYLNTKLIADANFTADDAKHLILSSIRRMDGTYPIEDPEITAFANHTPTTMMVPVEDIRSGFYRKLYGLQGQHDTWYTGRSFCSDYSSLLWAYTDTVVDRMVPGQLPDWPL